jgi:dihydrofolate reductase
MSMVRFDISISVDGFVAGPNPRLEEPLGDGGEQLHEWAVRLAAWRKPHGLEGGETGVDTDVVAETPASTGAYVMGRNMFGGGEGPWDADEPWEGWWGDDPPFRAPVFVLTHHPREPLVKQGGTTFSFVTEGIEAAVHHAQAAAVEQDVTIAGGADVVQQALNARLVDEFQLHVVPVFLGGGVRLLDGIDPSVRIERTRVIDSPQVTHLRYRVLN